VSQLHERYQGKKAYLFKLGFLLLGQNLVFMIPANQSSAEITGTGFWLLMTQQSRSLAILWNLLLVLFSCLTTESCALFEQGLRGGLDPLLSVNFGGADFERPGTHNNLSSDWLMGSLIRAT
jgi:hypothetical protein